MFYKLFIIISILVGIYAISDVKVQSSLYKAEDNVFIIQIPKAAWREEPLFYMHCQKKPEGEDGGEGRSCRFHREAGDGQEKLEHFQGF